MKNNQRKLFRLIIPAFPEVNVFTHLARHTTALGPIMVATAANKLPEWHVEIIDENNCSQKAPRDSDGHVDHRQLQVEDPADVVGFYCGLSSTMPRVWQLAKLYNFMSVKTVAGGWHCHYSPEESLRQRIDVVVHGDGEKTIGQLLDAFYEEKPIKNIAGISYLEEGNLHANPSVLLENQDLDNLPYPDFGLLRFAKMKIYPIGRVRGCSHNCEFCSVKGRPRCASGEFLFKQVRWLVETRKARQFFLVDDRLGEDRAGSLRFFKKIAKKYGRSLSFTVQARLETARDEEFLIAMRQAGVDVVCIGYESPIDAELAAMRKGYCAKDMLAWTKTYHHFGFFIHAMWIFGYPAKELQNSLDLRERVRLFKKFIRESEVDTIQVLRPIPLIGTGFRERMQAEGKLFPLDVVSWEKYDGSYTCLKPSDMTVDEMQETPTKLMRWFYSPFSSFKIAFKVIIFPLDIIVRGWRFWYRDWRNNIKRFGGYILVKRWIKRYRQEGFTNRLKNTKLDT